MYMPAYRKIIRILFFAWIVIVVVVAMIYGIFLSPISPFHKCTLMGCRDTLELTFTHEPPQRYTILLKSPAGDTRTITCNTGEITPAAGMSSICRVGIVTVYGFTPKDLTVEVTWQGGSYTTTGRPSYAAFRPNGLFCPPSCQLGKLTLEIP